MTGVEIAMIAASAIGTVVNTVGSMAKASQESAWADYNAEVATQNAAYALQAGAMEESALRSEAAAIQASSLAALGASGVDPGSGSALLALADAKKQEELDALTVRWSSETKAASYLSSAGLYEAQADAATTTGYFNAASSLLTGVTSTATAASKVT